MENLLLIQANNKEISQLNRKQKKEQLIKTLKCFNCDQIGHQKSSCPNPKKERVKKCFVCQQVGHLSKTCPKVVTVQGSSSGSGAVQANEEIQQVTLVLDTYNDYSITADIDGVDVYCQISTATTCNIMQEDVFQRIAREGNSSATLDTTRRQLVKTVIGTLFQPLGRVHLPAKYKGVTYKLDWVVVPTGNIPVKACLGTPFVGQVLIDFSKDGCEVRARKENPNPDTEELVQREVQRVKDQVNKRIEMFLHEQRKYLDEQIKDIKVRAEKKQLENGIKKTIKKIKENAAGGTTEDVTL